MSTPTDQHPWQVVVPVRGGLVGKSRLTSIEGWRLTDSDRNELALAMARDTISAAVAGARGPVCVLTRDETVADMAADLDVGLTPDRGRGLNAELARTAELLAPAGRLCVLLGDLPALRPEDLSEALDLAGSAMARGVVVPDWEGTGTTLVALASGLRGSMTFGFGPGSAERHEASGLRPTGLHLARLRCDVDTPESWDRAVGLGLGRSTAAVRQRLLGLPGVT